MPEIKANGVKFSYDISGPEKAPWLAQARLPATVAQCKSRPMPFPQEVTERNDPTLTTKQLFSATTGFPRKKSPLQLTILTSKMPTTFQPEV